MQNPVKNSTKFWGKEIITYNTYKSYAIWNLSIMKIDVKSSQILPNFGVKTNLLLRAILYIEGQYYES